MFQVIHKRFIAIIDTLIMFWREHVFVVDTGSLVMVCMYVCIVECTSSMYKFFDLCL